MLNSNILKYFENKNKNRNKCSNEKDFILSFHLRFYLKFRKENNQKCILVLLKMEIYFFSH